MQCPVCRAANDQGPQCRRCRVDLSPLFALEEQRRRLLCTSSQALAQGQPEQALSLAEQAHALRDDAESRRQLAICHLFRRQFELAWRYYQSSVG